MNEYVHTCLATLKLNECIYGLVVCVGFAAGVCIVVGVAVVVVVGAAGEAPIGITLNSYQVLYSTIGGHMKQ